MKLGLFGGSFDPIHLGHVQAARAARAAAGLDRVLLLPTADPPHKPPRQAPPWARYVMTELAVLGEAGLFVSPHELTPGTTAYSVETLEHFRREHPDAELHFLLGSDALAHLDRWRRWQDLVRLARLVVLARPGWAMDQVRRDLPPAVAEVLADDAAELRAGHGPPVIVERTTEASSTEIRRCLAASRPLPADVMPPLVLDYISKYGWYR